MSRWRNGRSIGRTLYIDNKVIGMVDTPELAEAIVARMNGDATVDLSIAAIEIKRLRAQVMQLSSELADVHAGRIGRSLENMLRAERAEVDAMRLRTALQGLLDAERARVRAYGNKDATNAAIGALECAEEAAAELLAEPKGE
jgi:hypothetical protein